MLKKNRHVNCVALAGSVLGAILVEIFALAAPDWMTKCLGTGNEYSMPGNRQRDADDRYLVAEVLLRYLVENVPRFGAKSLELPWIVMHKCVAGFENVRDCDRSCFCFRR